MPRRLRKFVKELIEHCTGTRVLRTLPHGVDLFVDLRRNLPGFSANTIFDVGANIGQSAKAFLAEYPGASVYCFEPIASTFAQLQENLRTHNNLRCFKLALGDIDAQGVMELNSDSVLNRLLIDDGPQEEALKHCPSCEIVNVQKLTSFCTEMNIGHIDILKIDAEGLDLKVLEGAGEMLLEGRVGVVQVEAGMNPTNKLHVPFGCVYNFMESHNYYLFGIYEQVHEWPAGEPHLRRSNPVFLSKRVISEVKFRATTN